MKLLSNIKNPWPVGLVLFFIIFIGYIVGFVIFASRQHMDLVREDYYDQEIRFQQQIDRVHRSTPMLADANIEYDSKGDRVMVQLPAFKDKDVYGTVTFYRPSDAAMDTNVKLGLGANGQQEVNVSALRGGLWKVRVQWKLSGQEYFFEQPIIISHGTAS